MKRARLVAGLVIISLFYAAGAMAFESTPIGWASVADTNGTPYNVTGGAGGPTVTVSTAADFKYYVYTLTSPYIVQVIGTLILPETGSPIVNVRTNKTIIGIGSAPTIYGRLNISNRSNIIIRNLNINYNADEGSSDPWTDGISVQNSNHIWIDHCSIYNSPDGLIDMTNMSDFITVSWCKFYYETGIYNTLHHFTNLIGSDDDYTGDRGKLHITMHHNWWADRCRERMPRVRFGQVHVYNNYYNCTGNNYCIRPGVEAQLLIENNYFDHVDEPIEGDDDADPNSLVESHNNIFDNCTNMSTLNPGNDDVFTPPYSYTPDDTNNIPSIIMGGAGANKLTPSPNPMTFSVVPYAVDGCSIAMTATTATCADGVQYLFTCSTPGGHSSAWQTSPSYTDTGLLPGTTYTYTVQTRNQAQTIFTGAASNPVSATTIPVNDFNSPTPNPLVWAVAPHGTDLHSISMTATTATDSSGVEYLFTCTSGSGHSSTWQDSTTYTDTGLAEGSTCTYIVVARDKSPNHNTTTESDPATGTTLVDTTAPEPNQMTFAVAPYELGLDSITMTATTATDISGVEYYFANITDPNHDSSWQDDTTYTDTGLTNNTTYTYCVIARDKSLSQNETAWSNEANATTLRYTCSGTIGSDLDNNCKVDFLDYALMASHWNDVLPLNNNIAVNGTFDTDIVPGWQTFDLPSAVGTFYAEYDEYNGDPPGSAVVESVPNITEANGHYFYQVIPVKAGKQYKLSAEWMGDISGYVTSDPCHLSNWAQVLIAFETNADANTWTAWTDPNAVMYEKVFGVATRNIDSSGTWPTWESITASHMNGPADGVFTASGDYMVVAFSEGGLPWSGEGYFYVDNVKVEGPACATIDLNGDCSLDWLDILDLAEEWLSCNRNPPSECWQ